MEYTAAVYGKYANVGVVCTQDIDVVLCLTYRYTYIIVRYFVI